MLHRRDLVAGGTHSAANDWTTGSGHDDRQCRLGVSAEGTVFAGYNYQYRKFTDFDAFESQNWVMTALSKTFGTTSNVRIDATFSLEPFTLRDIGSPQVFQTGETFKGAPLIDYQHPHDLIMNLGAEYSRSIGNTTVVLQGYAVGVGGDLTGYLVPENLSESYGSPLSMHVYLRYRGIFPANSTLRPHHGR